MNLKESIFSHIKKLEGFRSRYYAMPGNLSAQEYIEHCLKGYGYSVERSLAEHKGQSYVSPWALKAGKGGLAGKFFLLTAHFDSISQDKDGKILDEAPGADDNATGVAVLLEAARALKGLELDQSVGFAFFNLEEIGQFGSKQWAKEWKEKGARLDGVINIDTIGTWPLSLAQGGKVNFVSNELSRPFMNLLGKSLKLPLKPAATPWEDDHASFWAQGFQAIELTEEGCTPAMHSPQDSSEKLDMDSVAGVAEAVIDMFNGPLG